MYLQNHPCNSQITIEKLNLIPKQYILRVLSETNAFHFVFFRF